LHNNQQTSSWSITLMNVIIYPTSKFHQSKYISYAANMHEPMISQLHFRIKLHRHVAAGVQLWRFINQ